MADEQTVRAGIDATIAELEAKIATMQEAIASLRKAQDALDLLGTAVGGSAGTGRVAREIQVDQFVGMSSIVDAAQAYLKLVGRPARPTAEIIEGLAKGGMRKVSPDSFTTLLTRSHNGEGPVVRAQKGYWGLAEWYGKRPPKIGRSTKDIVENGMAEGKSAEELTGEETEGAEERG